MNAVFYSPLYGTIPLRPVAPLPAAPLLLPHTAAWQARGDYGQIWLQEVPLEGLLLRYLIFQLQKTVHLFFRAPSTGLQSLIVIKGGVEVGLGQGPLQPLLEGQFALLKTAEEETPMVLDKDCRLLQVQYSEGQYGDLLPLFPRLQKDLQKALRRPRFLLTPPRPVRYTVRDAIREIFHENYQPRLLPTYWALKLRQALFTQLAQAYTEEAGRRLTPLEREKAEQARAIIEQDLRRHYSNEELARLVDWSESSLKRAFRLAFGMGMYEYLRRLRMHKARELLLQGEQVKAVAPAVGMRPSNFTMEFQKFFGYKATSLRSGKP